MYLAPLCDGTKGNRFYVGDEEHGLLIEFNGVDFIFCYETFVYGFSKEVVTALSKYANTPVKEREPESQLYNIIIAQEHDDGKTWYTTWRKIKNSTFETAYATTLGELNHEDYQFTQKEIDLLKKELPENQKKIVDLGVTPVKPKEEGALPF